MGERCPILTEIQSMNRSSQGAQGRTELNNGWTGTGISFVRIRGTGALGPVWAGQPTGSSTTEEASIDLHKKFVFIEEGRHRRCWFLNGSYGDEILFGLTREEFDAGKNRAIHTDGEEAR